MAIQATHLVAGRSTSTQSSYTTAVVAPPEDGVLVLAIANGHSDGVNDRELPSTVSGSGTWTMVRSREIWASMYISVWKCVNPSTTSTLTINFPSAQTVCHWSVTQFEGAEDVINSAADDGGNLTYSLTLPSSVQPGSATYGACAINGSTTMTAGTGYSTLSTGAAAGTPFMRLGEVIWRQDGQETVDWVSHSNAVRGIIGVEVTAVDEGTPEMGWTDLTSFTEITESPYVDNTVTPGLYRYRIQAIDGSASSDFTDWVEIEVTAQDDVFLLRIGSTDVGKIYLGNTQITKVYLGEIQLGES